MKHKQALTQVLRKRYQQALRPLKTKILDELVATTGYNRSYARRVLRRKIIKTKHHSQLVRPIIYDQQLVSALRTLWIAADNICSKRLKPFLPELIEIMEARGETVLLPTVRQKLLRISCATIDRLLQPVRRSYRLKGKCTTRPGTLLRTMIPIRTYADWNEKRPGFFESDLVAFCGESNSGDFVNVLDNTDVFTGWVALEAFMGKAQSRVYPGFSKSVGTKS